MKRLVLLFAALLVAGCGEKSSSEGSESASEKPTAPSETPNSLSDADVERLLKEAVDHESLEERGDFLYQNDEPYSGWVKSVADSGQVMGLGQCKDGKPDGLSMAWHENGQKIAETTFKDGEEVSGKYWNSKGEEVETYQEARK